MISLETGERTYSTLMDAAPTLKELGIMIRMEEREQLERERRDDRWIQMGGALRCFTFTHGLQCTL